MIYDNHFLGSFRLDICRLFDYIFNVLVSLHRQGTVVSESCTEKSKTIDIESRFYRYLIDMKYALREVDFDDGVNIGEEGESTKESKPAAQAERILLEVEEKRIRKVKMKQIAESKTVEAMANSLRPHVVEHVKKKVEDHEHVTNHLLRLPANFLDLVDILYTTTSTYSRVAGIVKLNHIHDRNLLNMVNRSDFQVQIGKPVSQRIRDTQIAISLLGVAGTKALLPVMMLKQTIKLRNEYFPLLGFKLWKMMLSNGLASHYILSQKGYHDPVEGLLAGMIYNLGKVSIYHQFVASFDEVKKDFLIRFRNEGKKLQHDYLLKVEPEPALLFHVMQQLVPNHSLKLIQSLEMNKQRPKGMGASLEQALSICSIEQCDSLARAIRQGNAYSQLEQLRHAKLVGKENIAPFLDSVGMSKEGMATLLKRNLTRLELRQFVES